MSPRAYAFRDGHGPDCSAKPQRAVLASHPESDSPRKARPASAFSTHETVTPSAVYVSMRSPRPADPLHVVITRRPGSIGCSHHGPWSRPAPDHPAVAARRPDCCRPRYRREGSPSAVWSSISCAAGSMARRVASVCTDGWQVPGTKLIPRTSNVPGPMRAAGAISGVPRTMSASLASRRVGRYLKRRVERVELHLWRHRLGPVEQQPVIVEPDETFQSRGDGDRSQVRLDVVGFALDPAVPQQVQSWGCGRALVERHASCRCDAETREGLNR